MKSLIELLYSALLGVAVALFIGFGIWAMYPGPKMPEYPMINYSQNGELSSEDQQKQKDYDETYKKYQNEENDYGQKVAIAATVTAVVFFAVAMWRIKRNEVLRDGLALGGIFTSIYALTRSSSSSIFMGSDGSNRIITFVAVTSLLAMVIVLALTKFKPEANGKRR